MCEQITKVCELNRFVVPGIVFCKNNGWLALIKWQTIHLGGGLGARIVSGWYQNAPRMTQVRKKQQKCGEVQFSRLRASS